jgi:enoyl-[acyl-carrier protein] reductase II
MAIRTALCDLLAINHPIMLAGMGGVSYAEVCAAVSNAGGYGCLGMAGRSPSEIRDEMRKVRALTDKPFGVDLLAAVPSSLEDSVDIIIAEGASSFVAGLGVPAAIIEKLHSAGLKVMVVCGAVSHAVKAEAAGCDAVICQGSEGGGHTGLVGTLPLVSQAVSSVSIPVVAAGGISDGRGLAAALSLGAVGVWMGTRFIASEEAHAAQMYKDAVLAAKDTDTVRTRSYSGKPMRVKANAWVADWETRPQDIKPFPQQAMISLQSNAMGGIGDRSCFAMGQATGGIADVLPCATIIQRTLAEAEAAVMHAHACIRVG